MRSEQTDDQFVNLAKMAVEQYIREGAVRSAPAPLPEEFSVQAGVFVCLKKHGQLRGCIGTIEPTRENLAEEIIHSSISAAAQDPRFPRVSSAELDDIRYTVDILGAAETISSLNDLDPKRYGVIVRSGYRRGLLLPDIEGVNTAEEQVDIARRKAGIFEDEPVSLFRFEVIRHGEDG